MSLALPHVLVIFVRVWFVYEPTGTDVCAITMCILLMPVAVEAKSASDVMFFGFPCAKITQSLFVVKLVF